MAYLNNLEGDRARRLLRETQQEKERNFDQLVELKGGAVATFAKDYSFWDDMVRFVQSGDRQWAAENIDVALSTISVEQASRTRLRVHVADTGISIVPDRLERLFTPFERLGVEKAGIEGSASLLTVSKGLVEAMGGAIGVESVPGAGTDFWFELPIAPQPVPDEVDARTAAGS
ncbi:MAG: ATP-binding protein [Anaerolineales bacterium]